MRLIFTAFACVCLPTIVAAQSVTATTALPALPPIGLPLPQIGLPLPPIGLPLPALGLAPKIAPPPLHAPGRPTFGDGRTRGPRKAFHHSPTIVYIESPYAWGYPSEPPPSDSQYAAREVPPADAPDVGRIRLELQPAAAPDSPDSPYSPYSPYSPSLLQVYVDGTYVGTGDDVGNELELKEGTHRLELRAAGYETIVVDVRITALRTITYRAELKPIAREQLSARDADPLPRSDKPEPAAKHTFYLIPGCYLGNVPPQEVKLPANCDLSRLITRTP